MFQLYDEAPRANYSPLCTVLSTDDPFTAPLRQSPSDCEIARSECVTSRPQADLLPVPVPLAYRSPSN
jgi:hypothetical protein